MTIQTAFVLAVAAAVVMPAFGCKSNAEGRATPASAASQAAALRADTDVAFSVTSRPAEGACVAGAPCTVKVHLVAAREYHVNEEYPYRFAPQATPALTYPATQPAFQKESEREGTLPISFIVKNSGPAKVVGTFKLSVCSKDVCLIEESKVDVDVVATAAN